MSMADEKEKQIRVPAKEEYGYAIFTGSQLLLWTAHPDAAKAKQQYVEFLQQDDKKIKTWEQCHAYCIAVRMMPHDPAFPLNKIYLEVWLAGYRRGLSDAANPQGT